MAEYIKREDIVQAISSCTRINGDSLDDYDTMMIYEINDLIDCIPAADVRENVRGEWIHTIDDVYDFYKCSVCGLEIEAPGGVPTESVCPNCGAYMRGEQK